MIEASWAARAVLILLMAASGTAFWLRFRRVLRIIRASKPAAGYSIGALAPRIQKFVWEVLCQGKVIDQRPSGGLAHAFVFWGFCAFALITLNHLATAFGLRFLNQTNAFGRFYFSFVAVWAVMVAVSITGLAVRRFISQPKWLGEVSPESGLIAGLIFVLMATYLAGLWIGDTGVAGSVVWWLHTLALLGFLPLIPHTKHLHLVLSPATVFLKREEFSDIPPLVGDEDFGLDTGKDVTRIDALQAFSCVECGRCTEHCPAYNTGKVLNPKEVILGLRDYLNEYGANGRRRAAAGRAHLRGGRVPVHHVWRLRVSMSGGDSTPADDRGPAPRGCQHREVGRRVRLEDVPCSGAQRQLPRVRFQRAAEVHRKECAADV